MVETIYYINDEKPLDTKNVPAVICSNYNILKHHIEKCHNTDTAVLIADDISQVKDYDIDGIYFSEKISLKKFKEIRNKYSNFSIGVNCVSSKHDGLNYGDAGADFIVFDDRDNELIDWWVEMIELPVVLNCTVNKQTNADFIMLATDS